MVWFPKLRKHEWFILVLILVGFLILATRNLTRLPIFVDEAIYLRWAQIAWHDPSWRFISLTDGKQPFYIWLVIPFMKMIADPLAAGRAASVFSGLLTVVGMGYLGWLLKDKRLGFYAMLLTALSPYLYFYYRFGIMESTLVASVIWVINFSILLARTSRLDMALLLGMITGLSLLVKSSALFFCLIIPFPFFFTQEKSKLSRRFVLKYLALVAIAWILAAVIYNIQRLSPWMNVIAEKNAFFTVPYSEIFAEPSRLWGNFLNVWRWQVAYSTIPVLLFSLWGLFRFWQQNRRLTLLNLAWLFGPVVGTVAIARLFAPRYIIYATPFVLLLAAYGLVAIKNRSQRWFLAAVVSIWPLILIGRLILDPIHFPYVSVDEGYVNGWSAGNGTKQIAAWAVDRLRTHPEISKLTIYTEGTFGILPHGLELYAKDERGLENIGLYPISTLPPPAAVDAARINPETYLILNNTETPFMVEGLELVDSYPKLRDNPMRLYQIIPR